ncbi:MAG: hypothetical protein AAF664_14995 [Planctomycetota bacterium]
MASADVRDLEQLQSLQLQLHQSVERWTICVDELRAQLNRIHSHLGSDAIEYWKHQQAVAADDLNQARDELSRKRMTTISGESPPATEATVNVRRAEQRQRVCLEKFSRARKIAIEAQQRVEALRGPIAALADQCESGLPSAITQLDLMIEDLQSYLDQQSESPE